MKKTVTKILAPATRKVVCFACAATLALGLMPLAAFAADSGNGDDEGTATSEEAVQGAEATANSFRYNDGVLLGTFSSTQSEDASLSSADISSLQDVTSGVVAKGIDVSQWQYVIDWDQVKTSDIDYVIIRCGWGDNDSSQDDTYWLRNVSECERLGIPYGVYIYSYATSTAQAASEAQHVLRLLAGHTPTYPVYIDIENEAYAYVNGEKVYVGPGCGDVNNGGALLDNAQMTNIANTFCTIIRDAGYIPGIYSSLYWWNDYLNDSSLNRWQRWVAQWNYTCDYAGTYSMWQYADDGSVPGISGNVDLDFSFYDFEGTTQGKVYRLYNPITSEHLFTPDRKEYDILALYYDWSREGQGWVSPTEGTPVYRLYNAGLGNHLYTSDVNEINMLTTYYGWEYDNYGLPLMYSGGTVPVYRLYNEGLGSMHLLTTDYNEYCTLAAYGWQQEGVVMYAASL